MDDHEEIAEYIDTSEIDHEVSNFKVTKLEQIGSMKWFEKTVKVSRLYRVAASESMVEPQTVERVKVALTMYSKCDAMVRELVVISVWKDHVLNKILKIKPAPTTAFPTYMALYYEVMVHGIVQAMVYHGDSFNYLTESCDDLVEYCVSKIRQLIHPPKYISKKEIRKLDQEPLDDIKTQHRFVSSENSNPITILSKDHINGRLHEHTIRVKLSVKLTPTNLSFPQVHQFQRGISMYCHAAICLRKLGILTTER